MGDETKFLEDRYNIQHVNCPAYQHTNHETLLVFELLRLLRIGWVEKVALLVMLPETLDKIKDQFPLQKFISPHESIPGRAVLRIRTCSWQPETATFYQSRPVALGAEAREPGVRVLVKSVLAPGGASMRRGGGVRPDAGDVGCLDRGVPCPGSGSAVFRRDIHAAELGAAVSRGEGPSTFMHEGRAAAMRSDDAGDEPDEATRGERSRRCGHHARLEVLQRTRPRRDHTAQSLCSLLSVRSHPLVGQGGFVVRRCRRFLLPRSRHNRLLSRSLSLQK
ncbi:hypothetical protein F5148DRAFT_250800 [Russula earlei]|uniref:Uncharacterized protein n=1 Tax=Russula earlei TaxID=71964 RepID=A0ACC0U3D6_9AGAM|nr:hypothetical protein F5148DRAFT_250800 [Russula earlei]